MARPLARPALNLDDLQTIAVALPPGPLRERIQHHIRALEAKETAPTAAPTDTHDTFAAFAAHFNNISNTN